MTNRSARDLEERILSHRYSPHPRVDEYLSEQKRRSMSAADIDITVRERRPSGASLTGADSSADQMDCHDRCITPARDDRKDLQCFFCYSLAINPFRCTTVEERQVIGQIDEPTNQVFHLCCYQCLTGYMLTWNIDHFPCPVCRNNEFYLPNLKCANTQIITEAEAYVIDCSNNCGLMGTPLALANHICPLQDPNKSGHTSRSIMVTNLFKANRNLNQENAQLRSELARVVVNYNKKQSHVNELRNKCADLEAIYQRDVNHLFGRLQVGHYSIAQLTQDNLAKQEQINQLMVQKNEIKRSYKANLKRVAKHLTTKLQEETEKNARLSAELRELLELSGQPPTRNDASQTDGSQSDTEPSLDFPRLFADGNSQTTDEDRD